MLLNSLYFSLRNFIPLSVRRGIRRRFVLRKLEQVGDVWPIMPGSERPAEGWPGWPAGRQFALVLTHDVESQIGLDRVKEVAELEMRLGFRSSFNLVPEGDYRVTKELRGWLTCNGFEVGVHDIHHDGKLFRSHKNFTKSAPLINQYLKAWDAVGFRSAFMLRNLDWIHALDIAYDLSTFDTDPFEPQPDGTNTIFPFWIEPPVLGSQLPTVNYQPATINQPRSGYVELPYTLVQDSTLFLLLRERTNCIWRKKLDWIAKQGGMVLLNTHPDYMRFDGNGSLYEFPASQYQDLLEYVKSTYAGRYWHALPREVARFVFQHRKTLMLRQTIRTKIPPTSPSRRWTLARLFRPSSSRSITGW
jgi:hypothetical protein